MQARWQCGVPGWSQLPWLHSEGCDGVDDGSIDHVQWGHTSWFLHQSHGHHFALRRHPHGPLQRHLSSGRFHRFITGCCAHRWRKIFIYIARCYVVYNYAIVVCFSLCLSVHHKSVFYWSCVRVSYVYSIKWLCCCRLWVILIAPNQRNFFSFCVVFTRDSIYAIARICHGNSVRLSVHSSVCLSVTQVDQSKTVEARITQFSPYSSPIPLVFRG